MKPREQLQKKINKLQDEIHEIDMKERIKKSKKLVGKCFKFDNSCGGERFWTYAKAIGMNENGDIDYIQLDVTNYIGKKTYKIEEQKDWNSMNIWTPIKEDEFNFALKEFKQSLNKVLELL